jgi:hypothetical protein
MFERRRMPFALPLAETAGAEQDSRSCLKFGGDRRHYLGLVICRVLDAVAVVMLTVLFGMLM